MAGIGGTVRAKSKENTTAPTAATPESARVRNADAKTLAALTADTTIMICCAYRDPIAAIRIKLVASAPSTAPIVFAASTRPTTAPGSSFDATTDASASGKLAPQRTAGGRTAHSARTKSSLKFSQMFVEIAGLIGQYGSDTLTS